MAEEFAIVSASIPLSQYLAGSIAISVGNAIFQNGLPSALRKYAPDVDPKLISGTGATELDKAVSPSQLPAVLTAYNEALVKVFVSISQALEPPSAPGPFGITCRATVSHSWIVSSNELTVSIQSTFPQ